MCAFVYCEFSEIFDNFMYTITYNDLYSFSDCSITLDIANLIFNVRFEPK